MGGPEGRLGAGGFQLARLESPRPPAARTQLMRVFPGRATAERWRPPHLLRATGVRVAKPPGRRSRLECVPRQGPRLPHSGRPLRHPSGPSSLATGYLLGGFGITGVTHLSDGGRRDAKRSLGEKAAAPGKPLPPNSTIVAAPQMGPRSQPGAPASGAPRHPSPPASHTTGTSPQTPLRRLVLTAGSLFLLQPPRPPKPPGFV